MITLFDNGKLAFGRMTKEELLRGGFEDSGYKFAGRVIYKKDNCRIAYDESDNWFTRYKINNGLKI